MNKPTLVERFADNGEHSHWELVDEHGRVLWGNEDVDFEERVGNVLDKLCAKNDTNPLAPAVYHLKDYAGGTDEYIRTDIVHMAMSKINNSDRLLPDKIKLSKIAEMQLVEIQYAFGCSEEDAVSYSLESLHAFENITHDQIYNWLDSNKKIMLRKWEMENSGKRVKLESN